MAMLRRIKQLFLLGGDVILLYLALYLALWIRYRGGFGSGVFVKHLPLFSVIHLLWLVVFFISGLYNLTRVWSTAGTIGSFVRAMSFNAVVAVFFFYFAPYFKLTPKTILFLDLAIFCFLFVVWRVLSSKLLRAIGAEINLVLVGMDKASLELARNALEHPELGCNVVSVFNLNGGKVPEWLKESGILVGENLSQLRKLIGRGEIDAVVVSNEVYADIFSELYALIPTGVDFYNLSNFWSDLYRSIPVSATSEIWFLENLRDVKKNFYEARKRLLDAVGALILLPLVLCLLPFIIL
ncbi:TPA: hypothetical protein EYP26_03750, partial [Candidatus Bathyarchaeota archaeon]|nr:hypothetical protein [Candidatus Bathyarchaeota archaeon]